jgi:RHS repeat-associated protein
VEPSPAERVDQPLAMSRGGQDYYVHADHQGSVIRVTDSVGAVVNSYTYDAYGQRLIATEGVEIAFGYTTGREYDAESGLMYYRARVYDPATARFLQTDPLGFAAGDLNLYRYVLNNPVNATDPSGAITFDLTLEGEVIVGVGVGASFGGAVNIDDSTGKVRSGTVKDFKVGYGFDISGGISFQITTGRLTDLDGKSCTIEVDFGIGTVELGITSSGQLTGGLELGRTAGRRGASYNETNTDFTPGIPKTLADWFRRLVESRLPFTSEVPIPGASDPPIPGASDLCGCKET